MSNDSHGVNFLLISFSRLRLRIYKGLGFEPVSDKHRNLSKMLVRTFDPPREPRGRTKLYAPGAQTGDIHVVDFDGGLTDFEYTQLLWKLACS